MEKSEVGILPYLQDFQSGMKQQSVSVNTKSRVLTDGLMSVAVPSLEKPSKATLFLNTERGRIVNYCSTTTANLLCFPCSGSVALLSDIYT